MHPSRIAVVDSHTGGEPTRLVVGGGPALGGGSVAAQLAEFQKNHDAFRRTVVCEPRGSDVLVGGLLCPPLDPESHTGVIFFNNVGFLGMCGHGAIGLVVTLAHLGKLRTPGPVRIETPVGLVEATWHGGNAVSLDNVPSYRKAAGVQIEVPGAGKITGDVAWGGNWFFLVKDCAEPLSMTNLERLTELSWRIRQAINAQGFPEVDHVELFGPPQAGGDSRNFVLCPGKAYDRSPCGTGTSAKLACLAADGLLEEGRPWMQESIVGSKFRGSFRWLDRARGLIEPRIEGEAFITAQSTLFVDPADPFASGILST